MKQVEVEEKKRRKREKTLVCVLLVVVGLLTLVELHLLKTSAKLPFVNSIFFFGLMNINIVLIMLLLFLVFRNAIKLILDQRRGIIGARLRTRLVLCFFLFAIIPTALLFSVSAFYIKNSFDKWFNLKIGGTLQKSIEVVHNFKENTEKNASHFVRKIEQNMKGQESLHIQKLLDDARRDYGLDAVEYYSGPFSPRLLSSPLDIPDKVPPLSLETLRHYFSGANDCKVQDIGFGEIVRCGVLLSDKKGVLLVGYFIPMSLASQLSQISLTYDEYQKDNPLNYPIKSTYFAILSMMALLILFAATWTGFYVARRLSVPIEELSRGTSEVASGNLDYQIPQMGADEMSSLVDSFNQMTRDLKHSKLEVEATTGHLKQSNLELFQRRRYIEVLLKSVQSGVISLDANKCLSMINPAAVRLLKLDSKEVIGYSYDELLPPEMREDFTTLLRHVSEGGKPLRREMRFPSFDGPEPVVLVVHMSVLWSEQGHQIGTVAVLDDVTEIQRMERMTAWREVAKRIAHEIKNPLTPIQLSVQRLRRRYLKTIEDDGTFDQSTQIVLDEVAALKSLVGEFSSFARLPEIRQTPTSLNEIVKGSVSFYRSAHERIIFELRLSPTLPQLDIDESQFKRVLMNLFDNAVAAMGGRGRIQVSTELDKEASLVRLKVTDEGGGILPEVQSQLFEPHFSTKKEGMGLGLAIVQRIVSDHGGVVRVSSQLGYGTTFSIELYEKSHALSQDLTPHESQMVRGPLEC